VIIYNTLVQTGAFEDFKRWLISQATADVRVQAVLLAWALGALLEGLVGFGYPWAVIAPILVGLGVVEIDAIRVAALANNAPCSFGSLGAPIIRPGRGDQGAGRPAVVLDRPDRRHPGPAPAMDPDRAGHRQARPARRLAAGGRGLARLHRGPVSRLPVSLARTSPTSWARWSASARSYCC